MDVDEKAIELLRSVLKIEQEETETRRLRVAQQTRILILENIVERYAGLGEEVTGLTRQIRDDALKDDIQREFIGELSERFERLERGLVLLLAPYANPKEVKVLVSEIGDELDEKHLKRLLTKHRRVLNLLKEQAAGYGREAPVNILTGIEDVEATIAEVEQKLKDLR